MYLQASNYFEYYNRKVKQLESFSLVIFNNISHILVIVRLKRSKGLVVYKYCKWGLTIRRHNVLIHGKMPNDWEYINQM